MRLNPVCSIEDGGWYVEVYRVSDGKKVCVTDVYTSIGAALHAAREWCKYNAD